MLELNRAGRYFYPNLAVGLPSNYMDLSEIEIHSGMMIILFFLSSVCLLFYSRITVWSMLPHNKSLMFLSRSGVVYFVPFWHHRPALHFKLRIQKKNMKIKNFNSETLKEATRYTQHMAWHVTAVCLQKTYKNHLNVFGIEWDRNVIIISDHLSYTQGKWLVYFSFWFKNLKRRPNGHVSAATEV